MKQKRVASCRSTEVPRGAPGFANPAVLVTDNAKLGISAIAEGKAEIPAKTEMVVRVIAVSLIGRTEQHASLLHL